MLHERRSFPPSADFAAAAVARASLYDEAADAVAFWEREAETLEWATRWHTALEWDLPFAKWFVGGTLNASVNCLDRHVAGGRGDRVAIHFVGEPEGDTLDLTYRELLERVCKAANALESLGVTAGDRVAIY